MLSSVDQCDGIDKHFARKGFGHLRPAAQFLTGAASWGVFVEAI
jgi:hypothetical protein